MCLVSYMSLRLRHILRVRNFYAPRRVRATPVPINVFPPLPYPVIVASLLALLSVPTIVVVTWFVEHAFLSTTAFGWDAFGELAFPLGACIFAATVFLVRNPMHALLSLLGVFFATVIMYLAAGIAFVGLVFLIVYVGAVAVLFLFVIMLLNVKSLTPTDSLVQHISQVIAIIFAALLLTQVQRSVVSSVDRSLADGFLRDVIVESTTGDAVFLYVRYQAMDINALTGLYTVHAVLLLVITSILLAALLGAIILATVTTERATAISDVRTYLASAGPVVLAVPAAVAVFVLPDSAFTLLPDVPRHLSGIVIPWTLLMVSYFDPDSNVELFDMNQRDLEFRDEHNIVTDALPVPEWKHYRKSPRKHLVGTVFVQATNDGWPKLTYRALRSSKPSSRTIRSLSRQPRLLRLYAAAALAPVCSHRSRKATVSSALVRQKWVWHWRRNRAAWLLRVGQYEGEYEVFRRKELEKAEGDVVPRWVHRPHPLFKGRRWRREDDDLFVTELFWLRSPFRSWRTPLRKIYLAYALRFMPRVYFLAWRVRAFCVLFFYFLFFVSVFASAAYLLTEEYFTVWETLTYVYRRLYRVLLHITGYSYYNDPHPWVFSVLSVLLFVPSAVLAMAFNYPFCVVITAVLFALDTVFMHGAGLSQFEFHESRCNFWRRQYQVKYNAIAVVNAAAAKERSQIHPDKGATDNVSPYYMLTEVARHYLPYWAYCIIAFPYTVSAWLNTFQAYRCLSAWVVKKFFAAWRHWCSEIWPLLRDSWTAATDWFTSVAWRGPEKLFANLVAINPGGFTILLVVISTITVFYCLAGLVIWSGWRRMYYGVRVRRPLLVFYVVLLLFSLYWWAVLYPWTVSFKTYLGGAYAIDPWEVYRCHGASFTPVPVEDFFWFCFFLLCYPCGLWCAFRMRITAETWDDEAELQGVIDWFAFLYYTQAFTLRAYVNIWVVHMHMFEHTAELTLLEDLAPYASDKAASAGFKALSKEHDLAVLTEERDELKHFNLVMWTYVPKYYDHHPQDIFSTYQCHSAFNNYNHYKNPYHSA